ncbi:penicillin-insensitive murein endopeptidase [Starkeya koreensis]|uniref:Penicillin-insensitive murein endopeptidase n=1 Tax=Ancylobacter koreensis TaxID=266121 RepID=A0ABT0DPJ7_9HYPH|nr:penicillin-insensitive murein endopeptidase [Ancylobacter koreensis]MCK0209193.1 penicillin-insensitive murein endopeptidase [Ancylobacter koreensis]
MGVRVARGKVAALAGALWLFAAGGAFAQQATPTKLDERPAKQVFGALKTPAPLEARAIGFYSKGCLAGAEALPVNGRTWQAMRLSRNRNWGHPELVAFLERFSAKVPTVSSWPGILVGDMAQPRGGPMLTGHASHQIGLDADIWLTPMPKREFTNEEREKVSATMIVRPDRLDVDPKVWTPSVLAVIRAAAQDSEVERVLVNAAIKKALCRDATGDRSWLQKVRPYWGHDYHMHVRIGCPAGSPDCRAQDPVTPGEGCGKELDWWFSDANLHPKPPKEPPKPKPPMLMKELPEACRQVVVAP